MKYKPGKHEPGPPVDLAVLEACLRAQAEQARTVGYLALAERIGLQGAQRIHRLTGALETLVRRDHEAGRPLLAALAVGRSGLPGDGFFQLLRELGRYAGPDRGEAAAACHASELKAAIAWWRR